MANNTDPYQILGVSKTSTQDEIKNAYRMLAKKYHPDLNPGVKESAAKFKTISSAYEKIGDPVERGKFDRGETAEQLEAAAYERAARGHRGSHTYDGPHESGFQHSSEFSATDAEDYFDAFFRSAYGNRAEPKKSRSSDRPGEDQIFQMEIDFKDAANGAEQEIAIPNGKKLRVKIPPGIESGAKLRFRNQGGPGRGKAPAGDMYVEIHIRPLPGFTRNGMDIETEFSISFIEAILGAELPVNTLDGPVLLKIPSGVSTGSRLRIRGKGIQAKKQIGDQIVTLKIMMPKKVDPELRAAIQGWDGRFSYDPRQET